MNMQPMQLTDYIKVLWKYKWVIVATTLITTSFAILGAIQIEPQYRATARIRIMGTVVGGEGYVDYHVEYSERITKTLAELVGSSAVRDLVQAELGLDEMPQYSVTVVDKTELFDIVADTNDPQLSMDIVNSVVENVERSDRSSLRNIFALPEMVNADDITLVVVDTAVGTTELAASPLNFIAFGVLVGVISSSGLAVILNAFDRHIYTTATVEKLTQRPVISEIPKFTHVKQQFLFVIYPYAEVFRQIRVALMALARQNKFSAFAVSCVDKDANAPIISVNLAYSFAQVKQSVVLVDADLANPSIHNFFDVVNEIGFSDVLRHQAHLEDVVFEVENTQLSIIRAGAATPYSTELIQSARVDEVIESLRYKYDTVIFHLPAASALMDTAVLGAQLDGVILVVSSGSTEISTLQDVMRRLKFTGAKLIGTIIKQAAGKRVKDKKQPSLDIEEIHNFLKPVKTISRKPVLVPHFDNNEADTVPERQHVFVGNNH